MGLYSTDRMIEKCNNSANILPSLEREHFHDKSDISSPSVHRRYNKPHAHRDWIASLVCHRNIRDTRRSPPMGRWLRCRVWKGKLHVNEHYPKRYDGVWRNCAGNYTCGASNDSIDCMNSRLNSSRPFLLSRYPLNQFKCTKWIKSRKPNAEEIEACEKKFLQIPRRILRKISAIQQCL